MEVLECIKTRRSIRKYLPKPVEWDKVGQILEAGKAAPSSGNLQNWAFLIVVDPGNREKIAEACLNQTWMAVAPVHIIVCGQPDKAERFYGIRGERLYSIQNCAAAVENMILMANSLGVGSCWVGAFEEDMLRRVCAIPDDVRPQAVVTLGYAAESPPVPQEYPLDKMCYMEEWSNRIKDFEALMGYTSDKVQKAIAAGKGIVEKISKKIQKKE